MGLDAFQKAACLAALNKLFSDDHFNICAVDSILKVTRTIPDGKTYDALRLLHCIRYKDMSRDLLEEVPNAVARCLQGPLLSLPGVNFGSDANSGRPVLRVTN